MTQELIKFITVGDTKIGMVREEGVTRVAIDGYLLNQNRGEFKQLVVDQIARGDRVFVLDLALCGYIDSGGLGVLVSVMRKVQDAGGTFEIEGLNEDLQVLFHLTKLDTLFTIRRTNG